MPGGLHPGPGAHGFEALTDLLFCYHVTEEYDPARTGRAERARWDDPRVRAPLVEDEPDPVAAGLFTRVLVTGARRPARPCARAGVRRRRLAALGARGLDVSERFGRAPVAGHAPELVLHTAAWTDVDGAEDDPQGAAAVNVGGSRNVARAARAAARLVGFSTDYVFDGTKPTRYDERLARTRRAASTARTKLAGERALPRSTGGLDRAHRLGVLAARPQLPAARCCGSARSATSCASSTTRSAARRRRCTSPPRRSSWSSAARPASTTWPAAARRAGTASPSAIMQEAGLGGRGSRRSPSSELQRPAPRPRLLDLRTVHADAPRLPHWREGLRDCLAALATRRERETNPRHRRRRLHRLATSSAPARERHDDARS